MSDWREQIRPQVEEMAAAYGVPVETMYILIEHVRTVGAPHLRDLIPLIDALQPTKRHRGVTTERLRTWRRGGRA